MAGLFQLVRRPRTRQTTEIIKQELLTSYNKMRPSLQTAMNKELRNRGWRGHLPKIYTKVHISGRTYLVEVRVDRRTKAGKIFWWVDQGTMDEGNPATTYPIEPVTADFLQFMVPYQPQTIPASGSLSYNPGGEPQTVHTMHVNHPGIVPRHFSQAVLKVMKDRRNTKGFYRVTENAYRRGFRKAKKAGQI